MDEKKRHTCFLCHFEIHPLNLEVFKDLNGEKQYAHYNCLQQAKLQIKKDVEKKLRITYQTKQIKKIVILSVFYYSLALLIIGFIVGMLLAKGIL